VVCPFRCLGELVLDRHRVGVDGFFARETFEAGDDSAVVTFVTLHGEAAFLVSVLPGEADEVPLRLGEGQERAYAEGNDGEPDGGADATIDVLSVTDFRDGSGGDVDDLFATTHV